MLDFLFQATDLVTGGLDWLPSGIAQPFGRDRNPCHGDASALLRMKPALAVMPSFVPPMTMKVTP
jgi:hypothetical protein